jgi:hypothetical protein
MPRARPPCGLAKKTTECQMAMQTMPMHRYLCIEFMPPPAHTDGTRTGDHANETYKKHKKIRAPVHIAQTQAYASLGVAKHKRAEAPPCMLCCSLDEFQKNTACKDRASSASQTPTTKLNHSRPPYLFYLAPSLLSPSLPRSSSAPSCRFPPKEKRAKSGWRPPPSLKTQRYINI